MEDQHLASSPNSQKNIFFVFFFIFLSAVLVYFFYNFSQKPKIVSITPSFGVTGTQVVINGSGFTDDYNSIRFQRVPVAESQHSAYINNLKSDGEKVTFELPEGSGVCPETDGSPGACILLFLSLNQGDYLVSVVNKNGESNAVEFQINTQKEEITTQKSLEKSPYRLIVASYDEWKGDGNMYIQIGVIDPASGDMLFFEDFKIPPDMLIAGDAEWSGDNEAISFEFSSATQSLYFLPSYSCLEKCVPRVFKIDINDSGDIVEVFEHTKNVGTTTEEQFYGFRDVYQIDNFGEDWGSNKVSVFGRFKVIGQHLEERDLAGSITKPNSIEILDLNDQSVKLLSLKQFTRFPKIFWAN